MKKYIAAAMFLILACTAFAGCSGPPEHSSTENSGAAGSNKQGIKPAVVDLTKLSDIMLYSEVYNMLSQPDQYMGKTIKIQGPYGSEFFEETKQYYHFILIADTSACCQMAVEFIWNGEHKVPGDYPENGAAIEITGVFSSYKESGQSYPYIAVEDIKILQG